VYPINAFPAMDEIFKRITEVEKDIALLRNAIHGSGPSDGGIMGSVKDLREEFKKTSRLQNMLLGGLIVLQFIIPFLIKGLF
jgi:hypothetical protein